MSNPSLIRRIYEEGFNQGNLSELDQLVTPGAVLSICPTVSGAWEDLRQLIVTLRTGFPDLRCTVEQVIHEGDRVAVHWALCGTHTGPFLGHRPTNRRVEVQGVLHGRMTGKRLAEVWALIDRLSLLQQLGLVPPPVPTVMNEFVA